MYDHGYQIPHPDNSSDYIEAAPIQTTILWLLRLVARLDGASQGSDPRPPLELPAASERLQLLPAGLIRAAPLTGRTFELHMAQENRAWQLSTTRPTLV